MHQLLPLLANQGLATGSPDAPLTRLLTEPISAPVIQRRGHVPVIFLSRAGSTVASRRPVKCCLHFSTNPCTRCKATQSIKHGMPPKAIEIVVAAFKEINLSCICLLPYLGASQILNIPTLQNMQYSAEVAPTIAKIANNILDSGSLFMIHAFPWSAYFEGSAHLDKTRWTSLCTRSGTRHTQGIHFRSTLRKLGYKYGSQGPHGFSSVYRVLGLEARY